MFHASVYKENRFSLDHFPNMTFVMNQAAEFLSQQETDFFSWGELDVCAQTIVRDFSSDASKVFSACLPSGITVSNIHFLHVFDFFMLSQICLTHSLFAANIGPHWSIGGDIQANTDAGYLSSKVHCLVESLLEYR